MRARTFHTIAWLCLIGALPSIGLGLPLIKKGQTDAGILLCGLYILLVAIAIVMAYYGKEKSAEERQRESRF